MYCGDETGSFIGDIGSCSARFGYGGNNVPSYVAPSMVLTQEQPIHNNNNNNNANANKRKVIVKSSIPTSCYNFKCSPPTSNNTDSNMSIVYDYRSPMRRAAQGTTTTTTSMLTEKDIQPITDPTYFLQQGDSIDDWEAYEHLWMHAIDTMSVQNIYKHTTGHVVSSTTTTQGKNEDDKVTSTTIRSGSSTTTTNGDHHCTHPFLVVSPGITHSMLPNNDCSSSTSSSSTSTTTSSLSVMNRSKKELVQITEIMMETLNVKAMFIAPSPMLSSFAHGRQTSLMVDIGTSGTRVTPVVDGLLLKQSQRRSGRGTDYIQNCIWQALLVQQQQNEQRYQRRSSSISSVKTSKNFHLTPRYQIKQQQKQQRQSIIGNTNTPSSTAPPTPLPINDTFHRWAMNDLMYEIRTSEHVALPHWWYDPAVPFMYDDDNNNDDDDDVMTMDEDDEDEDDEINAESTNHHSIDQPNYELPDGTRIQLSTRIGKDICRVPELFFTDQCPFTTSTTTTQQHQKELLNQHVTLSNAPLHHLIHESLSSIADVDLRRELCASIILTGGGSASLPNLASRLSLELPRITSSAFKTRVLASGYGTTPSSSSNNTGSTNIHKSHPSTSLERQCAAWTGGSILTSLGSFQQLWLSKTEYDEYGGTLAIQRFP